MILVVGGTGFIGKTLLLRLRDAGVEAMTVSRDPDRRFLSEYLPQTRAVALDAFLDAPDEILGQIKGCVYLASAGRLGDNRQAPWVEAQQALAPLMRMLHLVGTSRAARCPSSFCRLPRSMAAATTCFLTKPCGRFPGLRMGQARRWPKRRWKPPDDNTGFQPAFCAPRHQSDGCRMARPPVRSGR